MLLACAGTYVYLAPGVGVVVPVGIGGIWPTVVAEHCGKEHHDNQDRIGDGKYQHKNETDDAHLFGFLYFPFFLLAEGLRAREWLKIVCVCTYVCATNQYAHGYCWYETEESWQPAENCEDQHSCHAGSKGILGHIGGVFCGCLLCWHCRLIGNHLCLYCVYMGGEKQYGVRLEQGHQCAVSTFPLTG